MATNFHAEKENTTQQHRRAPASRGSLAGGAPRTPRKPDRPAQARAPAALRPGTALASPRRGGVLQASGRAALLRVLARLRSSCEDAERGGSGEPRRGSPGWRVRPRRERGGAGRSGAGVGSGRGREKGAHWGTAGHLGSPGSYLVSRRWRPSLGIRRPWALGGRRTGQWVPAAVGGGQRQPLKIVEPGVTGLGLALEQVTLLRGVVEGTAPRYAHQACHFPGEGTWLNRAQSLPERWYSQGPAGISPPDGVHTRSSLLPQ